MNRLDVYTAVHKMQRGRLFTLTIAAGTADPTDTAVRTALAAATESVITELLAHAEHEDRFIHPLLRKHAPAIADKLDAEHVGLDARLDDLRNVAATYAGTPDDPNALYRALAAFTAAYLSHLAVEEAGALPALWDTCSDEELTGILVSFNQSRSDTEKLTSLLAQLATLNPPEVARLAAAGLGAVPLADVRELLSTLLTPTQYGAVHR